jgi:AcrR family transcriptional regulator
MATQTERRQVTQAAILKAARRLFGEHGFAATTIDDVASAARVAKGAVYHHFATKEALFEAVFDQVSQRLLAEVDQVARSEKDALNAMAKGTQAYFAACAKDTTGRIVLHDGPAVLGWERWREVGMKYGLGVIEAMLAQAMADGAIPDQPVRATAHVLLGALDEAALFVSRAADAGEALEQMYEVCDRVISGITGGR